MLLHSFEKVPDDGVASPHTEKTLAYIKELKKKHGIDYDCHASYRFTEKPGDGGLTTNCGAVERSRHGAPPINI